MGSIVLQTISLTYLLLVLTCIASLLTHDEECLALFEFKQTTLQQNHDGGVFQKFDSWRKIKSNTSDNGHVSDCCLFEGVVCSNNGHVIGLDLSGSSLSGLINSSSPLFKLVHLQMLNLSMNNFSKSQMPSEIARLKELRRLDVSSCGFNGQIPNEISQLKHLSWLDLSGNPLKLQSPGLEYLLKNMTRLENLNLSGVELSSAVPRFLANFSSLRSIILKDCQLQDEFPSAIFHLPKLKYLSMRDNPNLSGSFPEFHNNTLLEYINLLSTGFTGILPESMGNLNRLEVLSLGECYFSGHIPGSLPNLTQLTFLSFYRNEFSGLVPSLASLTELKYLGLGYNNFKMGRVYDWINKLTKLVALSLDYMNIHGEILPYLANLTKLSYVSMEENFISGRMTSSFTNLTQLIHLDLQGNQLQGQISRSFLNFRSIEYLVLDGNNFSGIVGLHSFLGLNKLETLGLDYNRLSFVTANNYTNETLPELKFLGLAYCNLKEFPAFLRFQMKIEILILQENEIEGLVPNWIWNNSQETLRLMGLRDNFITGFHEHPSFLPWIRLEVFDVAYNQLQGLLPIPPQTIVFYDISNNNLTGEIPLMLCEVKSLSFLDLSSNKMTGSLPPCLGKLTNSLSVLDLKRNNFHGPMMHICTPGSLLKMIDLSENQLTGQVSRSLANCTNLEFISLADNSLKDVFPLWLGTLPKLQVLILRSNKFYGAMKGLSTISSQFLKLRIIDVSNNHFSGELPDKSFQTWNAMKSVYDGESSAMELQIPFGMLVQPFEFPYSMTLTNKGVKREYYKILDIFIAIDLSCNNFKGQIPLSLQDLRGLESLNLSNNHFTGHILPSLRNLKNLESLDLSRNELTGEIPQQLLQLGFLAILNVSFNHLDGDIPQGKQFDTFDNNSYMGNPGLCGKPLSKECKNSKVSTVLPPTSNNEYESLLPSDRIDWMVVSLGIASGLIIGIVFGSNLITRKIKRVRPRRNTRRN